jgi:hypothetical protein
LCSGPLVMARFVARYIDVTVWRQDPPCDQRVREPCCVELQATKSARVRECPQYDSGSRWLACHGLQCNRREWCLVAHLKGEEPDQLRAANDLRRRIYASRPLQLD